MAEVVVVGRRQAVVESLLAVVVVVPPAKKRQPLLRLCLQRSEVVGKLLVAVLVAVESRLLRPPTSLLWRLQKQKLLVPRQRRMLQRLDAVGVAAVAAGLLRVGVAQTVKARRRRLLLPKNPQGRRERQHTKHKQLY